MAREVSGCVTDGTLQGPLSGLTVRLSIDGDAAAETVTDEDGCYRVLLRAPEPGLAAFTEGLTGLPPGLQADHNGAPHTVRIQVLGSAERVLAESAPELVVEEGVDVEIDVAVPARRVPGRLPERDAHEAELRFLHGEPVDLEQAARLSVRGLRDAYGYLKHPHREAHNIDLIQRAFPNTRAPWPEPPFAYGECADSWGDAMRRLLSERGHPMGEHEADDLPAGAPVRLFYGDRVVVRYTTDDAYPHDAVDSSPTHLRRGGAARRSIHRLGPTSTSRSQREERGRSTRLRSARGARRRLRRRSARASSLRVAGSSWQRAAARGAHLPPAPVRSDYAPVSRSRATRALESGRGP